MVLKQATTPVIASSANSWNGIGHLGVFLTAVHSSVVPFPRIPIIVDNNHLPEKYHRAHFKINYTCEFEDALKSLLTLLDLKNCGGKKIFCVTFLQSFADTKGVLLPIGGCYSSGKIQISLTALLNSTGMVQFFYIEGSIRNITPKSNYSSVSSDRERTESTNSDDSFIDVVTNTDSSVLKQAELLKLSRATSKGIYSPLVDLDASRSDDELSSSLRSVSSLIQWTQKTSKVISADQQRQQQRQIRPSKCSRSKTVHHKPPERQLSMKELSVALQASNTRSGHPEKQSLVNRPLSRHEFYAAQLNSQNSQDQVSVLDKEFLEDKDYALTNHFREQCARTACHLRSNSNHFMTVPYSHRQTQSDRLEKVSSSVDASNPRRQRISSNPDDTDEPIEMGKHHHLAFHDYCLAAFKIAYCSKEKSKMEVCRLQPTNYTPRLPTIAPLERTAAATRHLSSVSKTNNDSSNESPTSADMQLLPCVTQKQTNYSVQQQECSLQRSRIKHERKQQICPMNISPSSSLNAGDTATDNSNAQSKSLTSDRALSPEFTVSNNDFYGSHARHTTSRHLLPRSRQQHRKLTSNRVRRTQTAHGPSAAPPKCTVQTSAASSDGDSDSECVARRVVEEEAARKAARDHDRSDDDFVYFGDALRARRGRPRTSAESADSQSSASSEWMPGIDSAYLEARAKLEQPLHPSQKKALNAKISSALGLADELSAPLSPIPTDVLIDGVSSQESKFLDDYLDVPNAPVSNFLSAEDVTAFLGEVAGSEFVVTATDKEETNNSRQTELLLQDVLSSSMISPVSDRTLLSTSESPTSVADSVSSITTPASLSCRTNSAYSTGPVSPAPDGRPELITVSMFWNDLPGLMLDSQEFVRLVDIHKQVLPAKPTGLLKSRCMAMNLPYSNCSELQRDFLIRYASADKSKSTLIVTKEVAKKLITYYVNPGKTSGSAASSASSSGSSTSSASSSATNSARHSDRRHRNKIDPIVSAAALKLKGKESSPARRPPKRPPSSTCSSRAGSVDGSEESPSSACTTRTASTTDTSGYYSTEPGSGGSGTLLTGSGPVGHDEYSSGDEPRRKRYKVNKRSLDEIAKERRLLKKRQKQLRKRELELMKNTIRQLYTPSKSGGYPKWRDSETEMVLLQSSEQPTRPHPPDMEAWERAAAASGNAAGRPARRGGNCLDLVHFDLNEQGGGSSGGISGGGGKRSTQQAGRFHFHLYLSKHAACVQCHSCDLYFNMEEFALHAHLSGGQLAAVTVAQQVELRSPYPTEMEVRLWQKLFKLWRGFVTGESSSPAQNLQTGSDSESNRRTRDETGAASSINTGTAELKSNNSASTVD